MTTQQEPISDFFDLDTLENLDIISLTDAISNALSDENIVVDTTTRKATSVKALELINVVKELLNSLYKEVNTTIQYAKESFEEGKTIMRTERTKIMMRNFEYIGNIILSDLNFALQEGEANINYFIARVESKEKSQNSYASKNEVMLSALKNEEYIKTQYRNKVLSGLIAYFKCATNFANQSYFLLNPKLKNAL